MIEPATIEQGNKTFKIIVEDELWDLDKYETRLRTSLDGLPGWNKTTNFLPPKMEEELALPAKTIKNDKADNEFIAWLKLDAEFTVERVLFHSSKVATFGGAYQCLLVSAKIGNEQKTGFIWSVYDGRDFIAPVVKPAGEQQPAPESSPTGTEIVVYAGQTTVLEIKTNTTAPIPPPEYPDKQVVVILQDEQGHRKKVEGKVVLIQNAAGKKEFEVEIHNGLGGIDGLADQVYTLVIDNHPGNFKHFERETGTQNIDLSNMKYIRPGWVYRMDPSVGRRTFFLNNTLAYNTHWPNPQSTEYYRGVSATGAKPSLPPKSTQAMYLGDLIPDAYFRIDQVLFFAEDVAQFQRPALFLACKISTPLVKNQQRFIWPIYDDDEPNNTKKPKAEILKTECTIKGKTIVKVTVVDTGVGLACLGAKTEQKPSITEIGWLAPDQPTKEICPVYYKNSSGNLVWLLGVSYKESVQPDILITLDKELPSDNYPLTIKFWKTEITTMGSYSPTEVATGLTQTFQLNKSDEDPPQSNKYKLRLKTGLFYQIVSQLKPRLHFSVIGLAVDDLKSAFFAYPILQHVLFFLPGLFGTRLSVLDNGSSHECWPETGSYIEWLATDERGWSKKPLDKDPAALKVLDKMGIGPFSITICNTQNIIRELKNKLDEFPEIYLAQNQTGKLEHVIYKELPFDWRLCRNPYLVSPNEVPLQAGEDTYPFLADVARRINVEFEDEKGKSHFVAEKVSLAGHSTGGVVAMGLVSLKNVVKDKIGEVFYISVPFWGAPKAEYLMLTGIEPEINKISNAEKMRQITVNLPLAYFLSPKQRYKDQTGLDWSSAERRKRFNEAVIKGLYSVVPKALDGWPPNEPRGELRFNDGLDDWAITYDAETVKNYPPTIKSYIFYNTGLPTISGANIEGNNLEFYKSYEAPIEAQTLIQALDQKMIWDDEQSSFKKDLGLDDDARVGVFQKGQLWQIYDWNQIASDRFYVLAKNDQGAVWVFKALGKVCIESSLINFINSELDFPEINIGNENTLFTIKIVEAHPIKPSMNAVGDGTVPLTSQLGLWYDLPSKPHIFPALSKNDEGREAVPHMETPNQEMVWKRIFRVFRLEDPGKAPDPDPLSR